MIDLSTPLAGLNRASKALDQAASRIAKAGDPPSADSIAGQNVPGDSVDLSADVVALLVARQNFESNVKTIQTADDMTKSLLNMLA